MKTRRLNLQNIGVKPSTNASLWLDKYIVEQKEAGQESGAKQNLVNDVSKIKVPDIYQAFYQVWENSLGNALKKYIKIEGRMIVGLGSESVLETSITLHRTYGVPYIPGSALKGLAASYAHRFMGADWKKQTRTNAIGRAHEIMFGSQDSAGFVIFHDALYVPNSRAGKPKLPLEPDILTVHHQKYYQGDAVAPADWDNPVPIPLLSAQGKYLLAVSANSGNADFDRKMRNLAVDILRLALQEEGIGAKTSSGYGRASLEDLPLTEAERQERNAAFQESKLEGIAKRLTEIGDYEKDSRKKFKEVVKDLRKFGESNLQAKGAKMVIERVKIVSQKEDDDLLEAEWFIEVTEMI